MGTYFFLAAEVIHVYNTIHFIIDFHFVKYVVLVTVLLDLVGKDVVLIGPAGAEQSELVGSQEQFMLLPSEDLREHFNG